MPFETAIDYIAEYSRNRAKQLKEGKKLEWSKAPTKLAVFDRSKDAGDYDAVINGKEKDIYKIRKLRTRIGWLCACHRDIKIQYLSGKEDNKVPLDNTRYMTVFLNWFDQAFLKYVKEYLKMS